MELNPISFHDFALSSLGMDYINSYANSRDSESVSWIVSEREKRTDVGVSFPGFALSSPSTDYINFYANSQQVYLK